MTTQIIVIKDIGDITLKPDSREDGPILVEQGDGILPIEKKNILSEVKRVASDTEQNPRLIIWEETMTRKWILLRRSSSGCVQQTIRYTTHY